MAEAPAAIEKIWGLNIFFHGHKDVGGQSSAAVYGVVGDSVYFAVEPVFCIAVWKHEIFCTGSNGKTHPVAGFKCVGQLRGPNAHFIDLTRFHEFRFFKAVSVFYIDDAICQLDGGSGFIHIRNPHKQIGVGAVG